MAQKVDRFSLGTVIILGSVWGLSECLVGAVLHKCAASISGSLMTAFALFFVASAWILTRRALGIAAIVAIACFFKMFDALLLSLPLRHGAVANPIFAFLVEGAAFIFLAVMIKEKLAQKATGQALMGGTAALLAVNFFPLVKFATGIPACVAPGTGYPLSLYYAPLAVGLSLVTVPLGFWVGARIKTLEARLGFAAQRKKMSYLVSSLALLLCLAIMALAR